MARKVFRIHTDGVANTGWFNSVPLSGQQLQTIITDGKGVATSIPTPFARIDLVKAAFKWVAKNGIIGQTAQHKLVSDALDVAQLFFLAEVYPDDISIVEYNPNVSINKLQNDGISEHNELASSLEVFWGQDAKVYNFNSVSKLYFVLFKGKLVGSTSPSTLFMSAPDANAVDLDMNIVRGKDTLLDDVYAALHEREWAFVEYMFALAKTKQFNDNYKSVGHSELYDYLNVVKKMLSSADLQKLNHLDDTSVNEYSKVFVTNNPTNYCDVLGIPLGLKKQDIDQIKDESDFVIKSSISKEKPLVLPNEKFSPTWTYTTSNNMWDGDTMKGNVPYRNDDINNSKLPVTGDKYPWLSLGNFVEDRIVKLPYNIDSSRFEMCGASNFLLPLTKTFFEYFKAEETSDMLSITELSGGGVKIGLKIPVKGGNGDILFQKTYHNSDIDQIEFHLAIFPFVKVNDEKFKYNIGVIDGDITNNHRNTISTLCFRKGEKIENSEFVDRSTDRGLLRTSYTSTEKYFDAIQISYNGKSAFVLPKMKEYFPSTDSYSFAIDFGTTNTHIEYKRGNEAEKPFANDEPHIIWASLLDRNAERINREVLVNEKTFDQEIIPHSFERDSISFPLRTAIVENKRIDYSQKREVFKHLNNFLLYEKNRVQNHLKLNTSIKWSDYGVSENKKRVESYIEYLISITYYKTFLSGGNLSNTKITWFYPISMTQYQQNVLAEVWMKSYKKVFGEYANEENISSVPESIAPFYYYHKKKGVHGLSVSVDIGGGSSDIAIFEDAEAKLISSFKYAGDAIYGDGYGGSPSINGFVRIFESEANNYLINNNDKERESILDDILKTRENSPDFSSFLFSLGKEFDSPFDYSNLIKESELKLSVLVFYSSIAYYLAKIMKSESFDIPVNILFSGTGSKSLNIIDNSKGHVNISKLFKGILTSVMETELAPEINIIMSDMPKEITCKGGLLGSYDNSSSMKFWLGGKEENTWGGIIDIDDAQLAPKYSDFDREEDSRSYILESLSDFYNILDKYFERVRIENIFGISVDSYQLFKKMRLNQVEEFLKEGIRERTETVDSVENAIVEETLFFYPLVGVLNKLSYELSKKSRPDEDI